jgi:hypothetical protein
VFCQDTSVIRSLEITDDTLTVSLADGRVVSVPLSWYPRLSHGSPAHRSEWRLLGRGRGVHWPELDEDISAENIVFGQPSGESAKSFQKWQKWYKRKKVGQVVTTK